MPNAFMDGWKEGRQEDAHPDPGQQGSLGVDSLPLAFTTVINSEQLLLLGGLRSLRSLSINLALSECHFIGASLSRMRAREAEEKERWTRKSENDTS